MKNIFIDPAMITTPSEDLINREDFEIWLHMLQSWLNEASLSPYRWFYSKNINDLLRTQKRFPDFTALRDLNNHYNLDVNIALISRDINIFFRDEEQGDITNFLKQIEPLIEIKDGSTVITPEHIPSRWLAILQDEMYQLLATVSIYRYIGHPFMLEFCLVTLRLPDAIKEVVVSTTLEMAVPDISFKNKDSRIAQSFPLLFAPDDLVSHLDLVFLWAQAEKGVIYAIEQTFKKTWQGTVPYPNAFCLGPHFIESVNEAQLDTNETVLSKIVRYAAAIIADKAKSLNCDLRHFRETEASDDGQKTRVSDGAKAWRLTLTNKGVGWRMHYWQVSVSGRSMIEFANIQKKNEPEKIY